MIDWDRVAALREEVGPEDFEEVVELFLEEVDEEIGKLSGSPPYDRLAEKLHFLKGSAMSLGFQEFSTLCQKGETSLSADPEALLNLDDLHQAYQTSRAAFLADLPTKFAA